MARMRLPVHWESALNTTAVIITEKRELSREMRSRAREQPAAPIGVGLLHSGKQCP